MSKYKKRAKWWTRERVILAMQRFYKDFGCAPTCDHHYASLQQFTGRIVNGRASNLGHHQKYPSFGTISNYFKSMRQAWRAAGIEVDSGYEEWSEMEDWFIVESCGILPRREVAEILKRTEPAVKRRLYDLGRITANSRWGISVHRAEALMNLPGQLINTYIRHGAIPVFRGHKNIYLNPADLLKITEFDWTKKDINPELERLVRSALLQRLLKILKFGADWETHQIYRFEDTKIYRGRIKNPRLSNLLAGTPDEPNDLKTGDFVKVQDSYKQIALNRIGIIRSLHFSRQQVRRKDGTKRACWMANVEFPKLKRITGEENNRIKYNLPLDCLVRTEMPPPEKVALKQSPEAVRSRKRRAVHSVRASERFRQIEQELS